MIDLFMWCKANQRKVEDTKRREHMACIIEYHNLVSRQLALGREFKTVRDGVPKVGN